MSPRAVLRSAKTPNQLHGVRSDAGAKDIDVDVTMPDKPRKSLSFITRRTPSRTVVRRGRVTLDLRLGEVMERTEWNVPLSDETRAHRRTRRFLMPPPGRRLALAGEDRATGLLGIRVTYGFLGETVDRWFETERRPLEEDLREVLKELCAALEPEARLRPPWGG